MGKASFYPLRVKSKQRERKKGLELGVHLHNRGPQAELSMSVSCPWTLKLSVLQISGLQPTDHCFLRSRQQLEHPPPPGPQGLQTLARSHHQIS